MMKNNLSMNNLIQNLIHCFHLLVLQVELEQVVLVLVFQLVLDFLHEMVLIFLVLLVVEVLF